MRQVLFMQESRDCDDKEQARSGPEAAEGKKLAVDGYGHPLRR